MNDNRYVSLGAAGLAVAGIIFAATLPPLGLAMLLWAFFAQRGFRRRIRKAEAEAYEKARLKLRREKILAAKAFP